MAIKTPPEPIIDVTADPGISHIVKKEEKLKSGRGWKIETVEIFAITQTPSSCLQHSFESSVAYSCKAKQIRNPIIITKIAVSEIAITPSWKR